MTIGTVVVLIILLAVVGWVIHVLRRDKRNGKNACGENCAGCAAAGMCHTPVKKHKSKI